MTPFATHLPRRANGWRIPLSAMSVQAALAVGSLCAGHHTAQAQPAAAPAQSAASAPVPQRSRLEAPLFYEILAGEMQASAGQEASAFDIMFDAARRSRDAALFERSLELAMQARSGDKALAAAKAWRAAEPQSPHALRANLQLAVALGRSADLAEPLRTLLGQAAAADRVALLEALPDFVSPMPDKAAVLTALEPVLEPHLTDPAARRAAQVALGRLTLAAGRDERSLVLARQALAEQPAAPDAALLAVDLIATRPEAQTLVEAYLARADALPNVRLAYARTLQKQQRFAPAAEQLRQALAAQPEATQIWIRLGIILLDLRQSEEARDAFTRALAQVDGAAAKADPAAAENRLNPRQQGLREALWLLLAQAEEQLGHDAAAARWLDAIAPERADLNVLSRRAALLARQGRLDEARHLLREGAAADRPDARARQLAEVQLLQNNKRWAEAEALLQQLLREQPGDTDLLYELSLTAERLGRYDDMQALLRRVLHAKPDDAQSLNALGYALADRGVRLDEARRLIEHAIQIAPDDPFIADSLGWLEYRQGRLAEAEKWLKNSYAARPHAEVAAHLGEVLWVQGEREQALRIWRDGLTRERDNGTLTETLKRFGATP